MSSLLSTAAVTLLNRRLLNIEQAERRWFFSSNDRSRYNTLYKWATACARRYHFMRLAGLTIGTTSLLLSGLYWRRWKIISDDLPKQEIKGNLFYLHPRFNYLMNLYRFIPEVNAALPFSDVKPSNRRASDRFNFIADVVETAAPAVVNIEIQSRDPFTGANVTLSNGSGFVVREDGLILTNAHVVAHRARVVVKLHDGRSFDGTVGDTDYASDLAIVIIDCKELPTLKLGSSANIRPGEFVVAMGSPLSLSNTITAGVVSSVHRESSELGLGHKNMEYIQTDAAITFGNSGGPLINLDGEVIGINSMKVTAGISFAIPADYAKNFLETAQKQRDSQGRGWFGSGSVGKISKRKRYIGVTMLTLTPSIIHELQQRQPTFPAGVTHGVAIWTVVVGSPAYNGGLQPGDVIVAINGSEVKSVREVYSAIESGTELRLVVMRRNKKLALTVVPQN